jgi:hypothetical protein
MALAGHLYYVTDPKKAFQPLAVGQAPTTGFVLWPNATVKASYQWDLQILGVLTLWTATTVVKIDGSFSFPEPPSLQPLFPFPGVTPTPTSVALEVLSGVPVYRSGYIPLAKAKSKELNIWVYVDKLRTSEGITAGTVSQQVNGHGLPGNTKITAGGPYGLNFSGTEGQVSINFNISIAPDTSPNLGDFLDLSINGWNIHVGWPTSWVESANDVLKKIKSGIAQAGVGVNKAVLSQIQSILETEDGLTPELASYFVNNDVSVTFYGIGYPNPHSWGIGSTSDKTVVLVANPCIGFPRNF